MIDFETLYLKWLETHKNLARVSKFFIIGCPKSGTTWLLNGLNGHPAICVNGEGGFGWRLAPGILQTIESFNQHQAQHGHQALTQLRDGDALLTLRAMIDGQLERYIEHADKDLAQLKWVGDKTPQHTTTIPLLHTLYPKARFIHILRDPRDAATSAWFHFGQNNQRTFEEYIHHFITKVWKLNISTARQASAAIPGQYLEIWYEDLHSHEAAAWESMLSFLGIDPSDHAIQSCMDAGQFRRFAQGRERGDGDESSFYRKGVTGDWINHIPKELADGCCKEIADLMAASGY